MGLGLFDLEKKGNLAGFPDGPYGWGLLAILFLKEHTCTHTTHAGTYMHLYTKSLSPDYIP